MKNQKKHIICILSGILFSVFITGSVIKANEIEVQKRMSKEVFRFHVLANSDTDSDQILKLQVKGKVLDYMREKLPNSKSVEETKKWAIEHLEDIEEVAGQTICEAGYDYSVKARVTKCHFPQKTYGDVTFPSGEYEALRIEIGKAKGQNWWCVLYPNLCFIDAVHAVVPDEGKEELREVLDDESYDMITSKTRFRIRWFFF